MSNTNINSKKSFIVYKHQNLINNKVYIGITSKKNPETRWRNNGQGYKKQPLFYNAIQKYGWENFSHEIVSSGLTEMEAKKLEEKLIHEYNSTNKENGYNILDSSINQFVSIQERNGMFNIGNNHPLYGKHRTPEEKEKISKNHANVSGKNNPMYGKYGSDNPNFGRRNNPETLKKMSISAKARWARQKQNQVS